MNPKMIYVYDTDEIESIGEIISKYNLLAVRVVDKDMELLAWSSSTISSTTSESQAPQGLTGGDTHESHDE